MKSSDPLPSKEILGQKFRMVYGKEPTQSEMDQFAKGYKGMKIENAWSLSAHRKLLKVRYKGYNKNGL